MDNFGLNLSDEEFQAFSDLVYQKAGINLHHGKKELVRARLASRIREGAFKGFGDYYQFVVQGGSDEELVNLLDAISTNLTMFFREPKHFDFMADSFFPEVVEKNKKLGQKRLRVWSAGCSTGEEPYSIAVTILEKCPFFREGDVKILATDLSSRALTTAAAGIYDQERLSEVPQEVLRRHFQRGKGNWSGSYRVKKRVRRMVHFRRLNLIEPFPFSRPFDLIFCRNVMIYFDKSVQAVVVGKFHRALEPGGYLFIGHSESLTGLDHLFKYVQPTVYRK